jgi:HSP20 family protein
MMKKREGKGSGRKTEEGFIGIFHGLTDLVEKLGELAEKGEELSKTGEMHWESKGKDLKGILGFSVKVGLGGEEVKVEPFGNIRKDKTTGESVVQEVREPMVDIFEEKDHTLVVAEMPGIGEEDVRLDVKDDLLTIYAEKGDKKYSKEVLLPGSYPREKMLVSCNNGMLEIKCFK